MLTHPAMSRERQSGFAPRAALRCTSSANFSRDSSPRSRAVWNSRYWYRGMRGTEIGFVVSGAATGDVSAARAVHRAPERGGRAHRRRQHQGPSIMSGTAVGVMRSTAVGDTRRQYRDAYRNTVQHHTV
eukprot:3614053-Rhodomonas_salina.2